MATTAMTTPVLVCGGPAGDDGGGAAGYKDRSKRADDEGASSSLMPGVASARRAGRHSAPFNAAPKTPLVILPYLLPAIFI
jgi:hypothetical protein